MQKWLALGALLVLGAALRVAAITTVGNVSSARGDEIYYLGQAAAMARGAGHPGAMRPPGFPAFLAAITRTVGGDLRTLRLAQMLLSLLAIAIVFDLVSRRFGQVAGAISAFVMVISPDAIHFTHFLWSEGFLSVLLLATVWLLCRAYERASSIHLIAAALLAAAAALTREMALYLAPPFAVWIAQRDQWRWTRAACFLGVVALCIAPWTLRNYAHFGKVVLISTSHWYPVADGNLALLDGPVQRMRDLRQSYNSNPDELAREDEARAIALGAIEQEQPWWIFEKVLLNTYVLFAPTRTQIGRFYNYGWLAPRWDAVVEVLIPVEAVVFSICFAMGILGLWLVPDPELKKLALTIIGVFLAIYIVGNAANRFRVPLLPFIFLYSGPLLTGNVRRDRWRMLGAGLTLASFAILVAVAVFVQPRIPISYAQSPGVRVAMSSASP